MKTKLTLGLAIAVLAGAIAGCGSGAEGGSADKSTRLPFIQGGALPASSQVAVPASGKRMRLREGQIRATGANAAGLSLVWVSTSLRIDAGAPVADGRVLCSTEAVGRGTQIAESAGRLSALYPRASETDLYAQATPRPLLIRFHTHDTDLAILSAANAPAHFASVRGVKVAWPTSAPGTETLRYKLPAATQKQAIELPFFMIWRAKSPVSFKVACTLAAPAGRSTVATEGSLPSARPG